MRGDRGDACLSVTKKSEAEKREREAQRIHSMIFFR